MAQANNYTPKQYFEDRCDSCHGSKSADLNSPILWGQNKAYLIKQLQDFKTGKRPDLLMYETMSEIAKNMTDKDIIRVSEYIGSLSLCAYPAEKIEFPGSMTKGKAKASSCMECHKNWNPEVKAPILFGQKPFYMRHALKSFQSKLRKNSPLMNTEAEQLTDEDVDDLSLYFSSNPRCI